MDKLLLFIFAIMVTGFSFGQSATITGTIRDTSDNSNINLASVAILTLKDSVLQKSARSNLQGKFEISNIKDGDYILLVSYPKYIDYVELFSINNGVSDNSREISLMPVARLLDEIVIQQPSVMIKGDTTEYVADSFKVRENATVEELLRELPGIQVDKDGKIIAQGQQVQKVLVDGDEFFSDDPTVATKNLRADAISRVQVFDKKSDQAAFTGIDDGQEVKAINLKLKEDAKKGYFGKASVAGLDKYYNATGMLNAFKARRKLSVFGVASSTDQTGLNFGDQNSLGFSGGGGFVGGFGGGGGTAIISGVSTGDNSLGAGNYSGQGLPESIKAGAHYDNKWNEGKGSAGGDYLFNHLNTRTGGNSFSQNTLFDSVYYNRTSSTSTSSQVQHRVNGVVDIQLDSTSQVKVTASGNTSWSDNFSDDFSEALDENTQPVNSSQSTSRSHSARQSFNTNAFWRKRFKKPGRTISVNFNQTYSNSTSNGILDNTAKFFDLDGNQISEQITDQNKVNKTGNNTLEGRISYTNPLWKGSYLELNYGFNHNDNSQSRLSYSKDPDGKYDVLVDSVSSIFQYLYNTNTGGVNYRYSGKKLNFSAGGSISNTSAGQRDRLDNTSRNYGYTNLFPQASLRYRVSSFSSVSFNYNGSTRQPTIDQLQPLKNNDDPLNIVVGNPDLKQSFTNSVRLNYNSFQVLKEQYLFAGLSFSTTADQINSSYVIDDMGRRVTKYINVDGNYSASLFTAYSRKLDKTWYVRFSPNIILSKTSNEINNVANIARSLNIIPSLSFQKRDVEKYDFSLSYDPSYNSSKSSISKSADQNYWIQNIDLDGRYTLPAKIDIGSSVSFQHRQKVSATDTRNQVIYWNAYVEKRLLKKEQISIRFSMNDILDQNKGYEKLIQPNAVVEKNYLTFQRYGLITLTYNFNTTGAGTGGGHMPPPPMRFR